MKKTFFLAVLLASILLLCSCGKNTGRTIVPGNADTRKNNPENQNQEQPLSVEDETIQYETVDVDLSSLSGTIAYSQVYDMLYNPSKYEGKIVKMQGPFSVFYSNETNLYYPAVIIRDATACCAQGIEFVLYGNSEYPSGYPEVDSEITVVGEFEIYYEGTNRFCHLTNAIII